MIVFSFFAFHIHIILRECESINFKESEFIHQFLIFSSFDCEHFLTFDFSKDKRTNMKLCQTKKKKRSGSGYLIGYGLKNLGSGVGFPDRDLSDPDLFSYDGQILIRCLKKGQKKHDLPSEITYSIM